MNEIYWITRLDTIQNICIMFLIAGIVCIVVGIIRIFLSEATTEQSITNKFKWIGIILTVIFTPLVMFVPSSRDAMLIFGVGPAIDYIQNNESVKQLPDKCINALNNWVESLNVDEKNKR